MSKIHSSITDSSEIHVPKGFTEADNSTVLTKDAAGSLDYKALTSVGITAWVTATDYQVGDVVYESDLIYRCSVAHTSGVFASDSANWVQLSPTDGGAELPHTAPGDIYYSPDGSSVDRLGVGVEDQVLTVSGGLPVWSNNPAGFADPLTTEGDLMYRSDAGTTRLPVGTAGQVLSTDGTTVSWEDAAAEAAWGGITGTLSNQTDLQSALDAKVSADGSIDTHSDVDTSTVAPTNGQALAWNGTDWVPTNISGGGGSPAGADTQIQYNNSGAFGASANLTYDGALNVKGTGTTSATKTLALTNSSDVNLFTMNDNGTFNGLNLSIGEYTGAMRIGQDAATNATGSNWTAIGRNAGQNKTTGNNWTAIGSNAGQSNTTSGFWTCVGYNAGTSNTTGAGWTCVGTNAAQMNTIGDNWTAIGNSAGINNTTGGFWTAIGRDAGRSNTTGGSWTAIGRDAGRSNLTGESWVAIGLDAGRYINGTTTALEYFENSAYIGTSTKGTNGTVGTPTTNETVIGYAAEGNGSNTVTIGNSSVTDNYLTGKVHVTSSVQVGDDTDTATAANVGAVRYRSDANNSYMDMCMQTGASTYAWVNIKTNTW